jgi:hypothetical protein
MNTGVLVICTGGYIASLVLLLRALHVHRASVQKKLDELERWRWASQQAERWMAAYPDIAKALDHVRGTATGEEGYNDIGRVRDEIRAMRRPENTSGESA